VDSEHPRADLRARSGGADPARLLLPRLSWEADSPVHGLAGLVKGG